MTRFLLIVSLLSSCFLDYWGYSRDYYAAVSPWMMSLVNGTGAAPQQYRVGVVQTAFWMSRHLHMGFRHAFTILDIVAALITGLVLYSLLERSIVYQQATRSLQWLGSAAFILLTQFYLAWLLWYQRPETLPTAALATLILWLWTRRSAATGATQFLTALAIILLSAMQGFVRADVAFLLGTGFFLASLTRLGDDLSLPRKLALPTSVLSAGIAAGIQVYMMKVVYPHASYGDTPVIELKLNLTDHLRMVPFILFMIPLAWTALQAWRRRFTGDAASIAFLTGSILFLALWAVVGKVDEVRIFTPFALCLAPLTIQMLLLHVEEGTTT